MHFDVNDYRPTPNDWLSTQITYKGWGHAEFLDPLGWVEGPVKIEINETGRESIELFVEDFFVEPALELEMYNENLMWLLEGAKPHLEGDWISFDRLANPLNKCSKLTVWTEKGVFETLNTVRYSWDNMGNGTQIKFHCVFSGFTVYDSEPEKYWVFPLTNFVSDIPVRHSNLVTHPLDRHPLRIFPTPIVPNNIQDSQSRLQAILTANGSNAIIAFKFNHTLGYIEHLSDYHSREEKLNNGSAKILVTAVMVGETEKDGTSFDEVFDWIPLDFLHLLSLSTGRLVGVPWIEFRDAQGALVRRIHRRRWVSAYFDGHEALDQFAEGSISRLLTQAPLPLNTQLRVAIGQTVRGASSSFYLEDKLAYFFRAFDTLCEGHDFYKGSKAKNMLNQNEYEMLSARLHDTVKTIDEIISELEKTNNDTTKKKLKFLRRVKQQVSSAKTIRPGFGQAVCSLIRFHNFPDVEIVDKYYEANPRSDEREWHEVLSSYRGTSIHRSYFMLSDNSTDVEDLVRIMRHVHDILLRLILKQLNYDGQYNRAIALNYNVSVDWVEQDTPAQELGYGISLR